MTKASAIHIVLLSFFIFNSCYAQNTFEKTYQESGVIYCVRQTFDSGYVAIGTFYPQVNFFMLKTDVSGDTLWTRNYNNSSSMGVSCSQNSDGGYLLTGASNGVFLIRTNNFGDTLWTKEYNSPGYDGGWSSRQSKDGGFVIAGYTNGTGTDEDICLIKTDSAGDTLWTKAFRASAFHGYGCSIEETFDHNYVLAGTLSDKVVLIKTNNSGDTIWTRVYGQPNGSCFQMKQTRDSGFVLLCTGSGGMMVIKTDSNGTPEWSKTYEAQSVTGRSIDVTQDGGFILSGFRNDSLGNQFGFAIRTDSNGDTLWCRKYNATNNSIYSGVNTNDSGFILGGVSNISPISSQLIKVDFNGITDCNNETDQFIVNNAGSVISQLNIIYTPTHFTVNNLGFQSTLNSSYDILCAPVGIIQDHEQNYIGIYPNPVNEQLNIKSDFEINSFEIYTTVGKKVAGYKLTMAAQSIKIDIHELDGGLYFLKLNFGNGSFLKKIIKD